jgi:hypothetical protein
VVTNCNGYGIHGIECPAATQYRAEAASTPSVVHRNPSRTSTATMTSPPAVTSKTGTCSRDRPPISGYRAISRAKRGIPGTGGTRYGSATAAMSSASRNSGAVRLNSASASVQGRLSGVGAGPRSRIFSALHSTFADSARRGRRWPSRAPAISTPRISSACSRRYARGYQASSRR